MKVLIVEDEELLSSLLAEELEEAGHTVLGPAETASEALAVIARGGIPELALVDIQLKHGSQGIDFAREASRRFDFPCIFVSGEASQARQYRHLAIGYISKPYRPATIIESVGIAQDLQEGRIPQHIPDGLELYH
jgi:two-component system, response regulator PdtaR